MLFYTTFAYQSSKPVAIFLHGFLGSHKDFLPWIPAFSPYFSCILFDLPGHGKSLLSEHLWDDLQKTIASFSLSPLLIGYSLGGRIAMQLSLPQKKVIALAAHVGLRTQEERKIQEQKEELWLDKLRSLPPEEFLQNWYQQPLFSSLQKRPLLLQQLLEIRNYQDPIPLAHTMCQTRLSRQPYLIPSPSPTLFLCGKEDQKYKKLYRSLSPIHIANAGHTLLQENPQACIQSSLKQSLRLWKGCI